jgi:hypothetical protein
MRFREIEVRWAAEKIGVCRVSRSSGLLVLALANSEIGIIVAIPVQVDADSGVGYVDLAVPAIIGEAASGLGGEDLAQLVRSSLAAIGVNTVVHHGLEGFIEGELYGHGLEGFIGGELRGSGLRGYIRAILDLRGFIEGELRLDGPLPTNAEANDEWERIGRTFKALMRSGRSRFLVMTAKPLEPGALDRLLEGRAPPELPPRHPPLEMVEFTVFRPRSVKPARWYRLLAFVHRAEPDPNAPPNELHPLEEVLRQAEEVLGSALSGYQETTTGETHAVPREGELTFVPNIEGVDFNPTRQTIRWLEGVHRVDFGMRAHAGTKGLVSGSLSVYLGLLLLAEIRLSVSVSRGTSDTTGTERTSARPYRKIFASYSRKDTLIVRQLEKLACAFGDTYLQDVKDVRSGENWSQRLMELIDEADIFQLFWSSHSMHSRFVKSEWEHALNLERDGSYIRPVYWQRPMPCAPGLPPPALAKLHFQYIGAPEFPSPTGSPLKSSPMASTRRERSRLGAPEFSSPPDRSLPPAPTRGERPPKSSTKVRSRLTLLSIVWLVAVALWLGVDLWTRETWRPPPPASTRTEGTLLVVLASYSLDHREAFEWAESLARIGHHVSVYKHGDSYRLMYGPFSSMSQALIAQEDAALWLPRTPTVFDLESACKGGLTCSNDNGVLIYECESWP